MAGKIRYSLNANDQMERMEGADELVNRLNVLEGAKLTSGKTWDDKALDKVLTRMISGTQQPLEGLHGYVPRLGDARRADLLSAGI